MLNITFGCNFEVQSLPVNAICRSKLMSIAVSIAVLNLHFIETYIFQS